eukprot:1229890-Ditylum_brightwellii.AAC.1
MAPMTALSLALVMAESWAPMMTSSLEPIRVSKQGLDYGDLLGPKEGVALGSDDGKEQDPNNDFILGSINGFKLGSDGSAKLSSNSSLELGLEEGLELGSEE